MARLDNDNTRRAYGRSLGSFFAFLEDGGREHIQDIGPDARTTSKPPKANGPSTASLKQQSTAIRMLLDHHLVTGGVLEHNPALSVKVPPDAR